MINYVNLSQLVICAYFLYKEWKFDSKMNAKDLYQYANITKTHKNSEYNKSVVRHFTSGKTQGTQFLRQKGFLLFRSCFWSASSLYFIDYRIKVPHF